MRKLCHTCFPLAFLQCVISGSCLAVNGRFRTALCLCKICQKLILFVLHSCSSIARKSELASCSQRTAEILLEADTKKEAMHVAKHIELVHCLAMILFVYTLSPRYEASGSFACSPRHRDDIANSCFWDGHGGSPDVFASLCNQHWPCINLCVRSACKPFMTTVVCPTPPPPPPSLPNLPLLRPCSQLQLDASQPSSKQQEKHKKYQVVYQPISTKTRLSKRIDLLTFGFPMLVHGASFGPKRRTPVISRFLELKQKECPVLPSDVALVFSVEHQPKAKKKNNPGSWQVGTQNWTAKPRPRLRGLAED